MDTDAIAGFLRMSEQKRAMSSEWAPMPVKKLSSTDTASTFSVAARAEARNSSIGVRGATFAPLAEETRGPFGLGRFLRSALWLVVIGMTSSFSK